MERDAPAIHPARHPAFIDCIRNLALAPEHERLRVFGESAGRLAGLAHAGAIEHLDAGDALYDMALAHALDARHGIDVIETMIADAFQRAFAPTPVEPRTTAAPRPAPARPAPKSWRTHVATADALRCTQFAPVNYVVPGFIPEGVTLLASRPKLGKSWLVLDLCLACAGERFTLGTLRPVAGDVLYLALEDNPRRLQRRLDRLLPDADWPARLTYATQWRRAHEGGLADIEEWCGSVVAPRLIVVDTLEKIRPPAGAATLYSADYLALSGLHRIASERGLAVIVVHHDRKADSDDPFDTVSGTLGLVGAADTVLILKRRATGTVLYARGRDIEESESALQFNKTTCKWTILGPAGEVRRSDERARVIAALKEAGGPLAIKVIQIKADLASRTSTDTLLFRMVEAGEVERVAIGVYGLTAPLARELAQQDESPVTP